MTIRNLDALFAPRSIAIVDGHLLGDAALVLLKSNLARGGFSGPITTVEALRDGSVIAGKADLALVLSGREDAPEFIAALGKAGTRAAVFISRGFDEWPADALARTLDAARPYTMRIVGPGSLGVIAPHGGVNACLAARPAAKGDLAVVSRSAAVVNATLAWGAAHGVGFSAVVSLGREADVDIADLLDAFTQDHRTRAVLVHLETVAEPMKFVSAARACARAKPVIVIRTGASRDHRMIGETHSSRLATVDAVYDAVFARAGLLRVDSIDELFDAAETITRVKPSPSRQVAILANGRSLATLAADRLEALGGHLAAVSPPLSEALAAFARPGFATTGPLTLADDASAETHAVAIERLLDDAAVDAVIAIHAPNAFVPSRSIAQAIATLATARARRDGRRKPIVTAFLDESAETRAILQAARVPCHPTPEEAVASVMHLARHAIAQERLMATPPSLPKDFTPEPALARAIVADALAKGATWLSPIDVAAILTAYDVNVAPLTLAATPEAAAEAARPHLAAGGRVAVKIASPDIAFKSDVDGVRLGLSDEGEVEAAAAAMIARIKAAHPRMRVEGVIVMPMIERPAGIELILGIADDPVFGPVAVFGRGGTAVEVLADRALDLVPLDMNLARAMIAETRVARLLAGYRNRPPVDVEAVALTLVKLSQLVQDIPEIHELDLNPLVADCDGVIVLDARMKVAPLAARSCGRLGHPRLAIRPYPKEWEQETTLKDGRGVLVRPVRPEDQALYGDFFAHVTPEDLRLRFFAPIKEFSHAFLAKLTQLDYARAMAFAAIEKDTGGLLGVVRLHADPDHHTGEYAILLRSDLKGQGLGWYLMQRIIDYARADGIETIEGEILRENTTMIAMCEALGFDVRASAEEGVVTVRLAVG